MNSVLGQQAWWKRAGMRCALLAGLLLAPSLAHAECGHYVLVGAGSTNDTHDAHSVFGVKSTSADLPPLVPASGRPCSGPGCKQGPLNPPPAPATPPPVVEKEWGHLASFSLSRGLELPRFLRDFSFERPLHRARTTYHPPRL
jgi:hypothetical protein